MSRRPPLPHASLAWLARETWLQARDSRLSLLMLLGSGLVILLCLSVRIDSQGPDHSITALELTDPEGNPISSAGAHRGRMSLAFGAISIGTLRDTADEVEFLRALIARWFAGAAGVLLALIATTGLLPEALRPESAVVLLTKPLPRPILLWGKALGVLAFIATHAAIFVLGTWTALGLSTGDWNPAYLLGLPIFLIHFAAAFAATVWLAVCTRSSVACALGAIAFWIICLAANQAHIARLAIHQAGPAALSTSAPMHLAAETAYWILPKPVDLMMLVDHAVHTTRHFTVSPEAAVALHTGTLSVLPSVATSLAFALVTLLLAGREFANLEY